MKPQVVLKMTGLAILLGSLWSLPSAASSICFVEVNEMDACKLYRIDPSNPAPRLILDLSQDTFGDVRDPEFSPNGQLIALACEKDMMSTPWRTNLWTIDRNGQGLTSVTHLTPGSFPSGLPTGSIEGVVYEDGDVKSGAWVYISSLEEGATADVYGHYRIDNAPVGSQYITAYDPNILYDDEDFGFMPMEIVQGMTMTVDVTLSWDWDLQQGAKSADWMPNGQEIVFIDNSGNSNRIGIDGTGLEEVVALPQDVYSFSDVAVRPTNGDMAFITEVWYGDESQAGVWICDANGNNMHQVVEDASYGKGSIHWTPDGSMFGYSTQLQDQQGTYVDGIAFFDDQGAFQGGVAMNEGWYSEFGGWDPSQEYICVTMWPSGDFSQTTLNTVRLSDYSTTQLYGPAELSFPSWGPEASPVYDQPENIQRQFVLGPAFPNPSRGRVSIKLYGGGAVEPGEIAVYDVTGRQVAQLTAASPFSAWNGCDANGRAVPAGTYIFRLPGQRTRQASTKVVILR